MKTILSITLLIIFASCSTVNKTYKVDKTETKKMEFRACKYLVSSMFNSITNNYTVKQIANNKNVYMVKAYVNNGTVLASCSRLDKKMTIITSN